VAAIQALTFDVGGSVFDWKSAVRREIEARARSLQTEVDSEAFAMDWRIRMFEILDRVKSQEIRPINADEMHRRALDQVMPKYPNLALSARDLDDLNQAWHRMPVWPEFPAALDRLKEHYRVVVLTILSFAIVVDSSKFSGIAWDGIISCEFLSHYKPDPEAYLAACRLLGLKPEQVMMVAAHPFDLEAAGAAGLRTAFVKPKLDEPERSGISSQLNPEKYDYCTGDFTDLADQLCRAGADRAPQML
jgi:2-haloacid dehalogenase